MPSLDALERVWRWDRGERWPAVIDSAFGHLRSSMPSIDLTVPLWGDARPANVIVAGDFSTPKALLDWELASVGPPELDVFWLLEMNRMRTVGAGVSAATGISRRLGVGLALRTHLRPDAARRGSGTARSTR